MSLIGSALALRCSGGGTLLVGKDVQPLQSHGVVTKLVFGSGMVFMA
jgi:hypothetical protein